MSFYGVNGVQGSRPSQPSRLDPSVPGFQLRDETPRSMPTPPSLDLALYAPQVQAASAPMNQYQNLDATERFMLSTSMKHAQDVAHLDFFTQRNHAEISQLRNVVRSDLNSLYSELSHLRTEMQTRPVIEELAIIKRVPSTVPSLYEFQICPRELLLEKFSRETVADLYTEQAVEAEITAKKLRKEIEAVLGRTVLALQQADIKAVSGEAGAMVNGTAEPEMPADDSDVVDGHDKITMGAAPESALDDDISNGETPWATLEEGAPTKRETSKEVVNGSALTKPRTPAGAAWMAKGSSTAVVATDPEIPSRVDASSQTTALPLEQIRLEDSTRSPIMNTKTENNTTTSPWQPLAMRLMPPTPATSIPSTNKLTFTADFLIRELAGAQWSPGFYFIPSSASPKLKCQTYYLFSAYLDPCLPSQPGQHGAHLVPLLNGTPGVPGDAPCEVKNFKDVPMFIQLTAESGYTYFGQYSQKRYSDKLDYDRGIEAVPESVRQYWAGQLVAKGRPEWVTQALMEHFWPRPRYTGAVPTDSAINTPTSPMSPSLNVVADPDDFELEKRVLSGLTDYAKELKNWEKEARIKVSCLTVESILAAFERSDCEEEPGLRFWWEYLECVGYDEGLYDLLVQLRGIEAMERSKREEKRVGSNGSGSSGSSRKTSGEGKVAVKKEPAPAKVAGVAAGAGGKAPRHGNGHLTSARTDGTIAAAPNSKRAPDTNGTTPIHLKSRTSVIKTQASPPAEDKAPKGPASPMPKILTPAKQPSTKLSQQVNGPSPTIEKQTPTQPFRGDLSAAKQMHDEFRKAKPHRTKGGNGGQYVPPHLRQKGS